MNSCIILNKGESLTFNYQKYFDLILGWSGYDGNSYIDDIDLCMFYKTKKQLVVFIIAYIMERENLKALYLFFLLCIIWAKNV